ncbi:MAG: hypothetical protein FWB93_01345 [Oscillospiraceae bacterium]|nr:hypothetical protein [Oscillospiraceae bacterium]
MSAEGDGIGGFAVKQVAVMRERAMIGTKHLRQLDTVACGSSVRNA